MYLYQNPALVAGIYGLLEEKLNNGYKRKTSIVET